MKLHKLLPYLLLSFLFVSCATENNPVYTVETTVVPSGAGFITNDQSSNVFDANTRVTFIATPNEGYVFSYWDGDISGTQNPNDITITQDISVIAVFEKKSYDLTITIEGEGDVTEQILQTKSTEYEHGTVVRLNPVPESGYRFVEWKGDYNSTTPTLDISITQPINITAVFTPTFYVDNDGLTVKCENAEFGESFVLEYQGSSRTFTKRKRSQVNDVRLWETTCTSGITDMSDLFQNQLLIPNIQHFDMSSVSSMKGMFSGAENFNQSIGHWDVSNVDDMSFLFSNAHQFNQNINDWDVSSVTNMRDTFGNARQYNKPLDKWNTENVTTMLGMFIGASDFNQPIGTWNTSNVDNMAFMFSGAASFNQPIGNWDVSSVVYADAMFQVAGEFNQDLSSWNTESLQNAGWMFAYAGKYNHPMNDWDVSNVTNMDRMFVYAFSFNQPLDRWDVSKVENMDLMFTEAKTFNQNLSTWCVSKLTQIPEKFSYNSPLQESFKPKWGTCPS